MPSFRTAFAASEEDVRAAQRLRYDVFVRELGSAGPMVDHAAELERDRFDAFNDHLLLFDDARDAATGQVVGVYRLLDSAQAEAAGQFYSEDEYDLTPLRQSGKRLLELGRSCVHPDYRSGAALLHLWSALSEHVAARNIDIMFGVASFHGTNPQAFAGALSLLHHRHLAPAHMRPKARPPHCQRMDLVPEAQIDRPAALRDMPTLIKSYLRLGGTVGEGAYIDHSFNTTDVFLMMDTQSMNDKQARLLTRSAP